MLRWGRRRRCTVCRFVSAMLLSATSALTSAAAPGTAEGYRIDVAATANGPIALYAEERGQGRPVVLLHGLGGSTYSWRYIAPILARTHRVIAIDLKGFGRSDKVFDTAYSAEDQAQLVASFLARRHLTHVTLIGHSFGGQVAMLTALELQRHDPNRIERLVLIDVPALPQRLTPVVALMQQAVIPYALFTLVPPEIMTRVALATAPLLPLDRAYTEADAVAYSTPLRDAAARHAYIQTSRQLVPPNLDGIVTRYRSLRQPTLLVWCTNDPIVPLATGRALERLLPHAHLDQLARCNHSPPDEAPFALASSLTRFLND